MTRRAFIAAFLTAIVGRTLLQAPVPPVLAVDLAAGPDETLIIVMSNWGIERGWVYRSYMKDVVDGIDRREPVRLLWQ